jgi:hypothetical protein
LSIENDNLPTMIKLSFSPETLLYHTEIYYHKSLKYFQQYYFGLLPFEKNKIPLHVAYLCPLCLTNCIVILKQPDVIMTSSDFDLDHYPQQSIGGGNSILVCKPCNGKAGCNYEFSLKEHLQFSSLAFEGPSHEVRAKIVIPDVMCLNSQLSKNEKNQWVLPLKKSPKVTIRPLDNWLNSLGTDSQEEFTVHISTPLQSNIDKALLKTAYLYCFAIWGYEFVFSNIGHLFRLVLSGKIEYPMKVRPLKFDHNKKGFESIPTGVCFVSQQNYVRSFVVNILLKDKESNIREIYPIFIPNPTVTGISDFVAFSTAIKGLTGNLDILPLVNFLNNTPFAYSESWVAYNNSVTS